MFFSLITLVSLYFIFFHQYLHVVHIDLLVQIFGDNSTCIWKAVNHWLILTVLSSKKQFVFFRKCLLDTVLNINSFTYLYLCDEIHEFLLILLELGVWFSCDFACFNPLNTNCAQSLLFWTIFLSFPAVWHRSCSYVLQYPWVLAAVCIEKSPVWGASQSCSKVRTLHYCS